MFLCTKPFFLSDFTVLSLRLVGFCWRWNIPNGKHKKNICLYKQKNVSPKWNFRLTFPFLILIFSKKVLPM